MHRLLFTFAASLIALSAHAVGQGTPYLHASAEVELGADGKVRSIELDGKRIPESARAPLEAQIASWEFEPARVDGRPVSSRTHVHVTLKAEPLEDNPDALALRIAAASAGPGTIDARPPRYPSQAIRAGAMADVIVQADVNADGVVTAVREHAVKTNRGHERYGELFTRISMDAVRNWRFEPEQVEGHGVATTILVPINFCIDNRPCTKMDPEKPQQTLIAEHPVAKLKTEVVGRVL